MARIWAIMLLAIAMAMRLDETGGSLPHVPILMLLDRAADVFLAQRSGADGWIIKPLDALRLKRAALAIKAGETYTEGLPEDDAVELIEEPADDESTGSDASSDASSDSGDSSEEEPATAG